MGYRADKPYGRRKTDKVLPEDKRRHLQGIRRDVDEDPSGMIRRYMRLASKALDEGEPSKDGADPAPSRLRIQNREAA